MQYEYFAGWPWLAASPNAGRAPATWSSTRRTARPTVALARLPGRTPMPHVEAAVATTSPDTITSGATGWVVALTPRGSPAARPARTAVSTTGSTRACSRRAPRLTATMRRVTSPDRGGSTPSAWSTSPMACSSIAPTAHGGGRHEREAVTPAVLLEQVVDRLGRRVGDLEDTVRVEGGHRTTVAPSRCWPRCRRA